MENDGQKCRLLAMLSMTFMFFLVEIVVGYVTNSTALIADSFHMLSDVVALLIAYVSVRMSPKKWSKNTFGWARAEVLGALINAVFLLALCFSILIESFKRFVDPEKLHNPRLVLVVGVIGLIVNVIGLFLFHGHGHGHSHGGGHGHGGGHLHVPQEEIIITADNGGKNSDPNDITADTGLIMPNGGHTIITVVNGDLANHNGHTSNGNNGHVVTDMDKIDEGDDTGASTTVAVTSGPQRKRTRNMNMHGVFLHVLADALGSVIVIISALIVEFTSFEYKVYVDPALSVIMVIIISQSTFPLLKESAMILLQTVPTHIQIDSLQTKLLEEIDGVLAVHEFHVWQLAGDRIIASAHIRCRNLHDYMQIAEKVKEFFHNEGIHSTTIQPEFVEFESELPPDENGRNRWHDNCALDCPPGEGGENCVQNTCCGPQNQNRKSPSSVIELEDGLMTPPNGLVMMKRNTSNGVGSGSGSGRAHGSGPSASSSLSAAASSISSSSSSSSASSSTSKKNSHDHHHHHRHHQHQQRGSTFQTVAVISASATALADTNDKLSPSSSSSPTNTNIIATVATNSHGDSGCGGNSIGDHDSSSPKIPLIAKDAAGKLSSSSSSHCSSSSSSTSSLSDCNDHDEDTVQQQLLGGGGGVDSGDSSKSIHAGGNDK